MAIIKLNNQSISAVSALPAAIATGKVLQVVEDIQNLGNALSSGSHGTWLDSGLTALTITPSSTSSKILIGYYDIRGHTNSGAGNDGSFYTIFRDINGGGYANIGQATYGMQETAANTADNTAIPLDLVYVDEPNTTSAVSYKAYFKSYDVSGQYYFHHVGYAGSTAMPIVKIAMEIQG